jgi:putative phosphoesterase
MRVLIISDIHANLQALRALPAADAIVCAGDVVGFGPDPSGVVAELMRLDVQCVRGEEDDAVARTAKQHPVPPALVQAAKAHRDHARASLSAAQMRWLRALPPELELTLDGVRIGITHAYPGDYTRYVAPTPEELSRTMRAFPHCDVVVVGHTHRRGTWKGQALVVNPGSVGMPQRPGYASYAFLEGGKVRFGSARYDPSETLAAMRELGISEEAYHEYEGELTRGSLRPHQRLARASG